MLVTWNTNFKVSYCSHQLKYDLKFFSKVSFITLPLVTYLQLIFRNFSVNASSSSEVEDTARAGRIPVKADAGAASFGWATSGFFKNGKGCRVGNRKEKAIQKPKHIKHITKVK